MSKHTLRVLTPASSREDPPSKAQCRCDKNGCCPKHDPLGYTGDGATHRTDDPYTRSEALA